MRFTVHRLVVTVAVALAVVPLPAARRSGPVERAQALIDELRRETRTPAISAAVARSGRIVFSSGTGLADIEHDVAATGRTVYNIGSVSKPITGTAIMQLVEAGRVRLDDDIRTYVPEFPDKGARITIRHLLTHTSGIRHYRDTDFPGTPDNENIQPVDGFRDGLRIFAQDALLFPPGTAVFYSSYAVNLLEGVVERASGTTFEAYLRAHVWAPAAMRTAGFDRPERIVPARARSYRLDNGEPRNYYYNDLRYKFASGGMIASVEDLVGFASALNAGRLLTAETRTHVWTSHTGGLPTFREAAAPGAPGRDRGYLWDLRRDATGRRVAYHCGSIKASNACVVDFIDEDLVAAIATNSWECCGWSKADALAALFRPR